MLCVNYYYFIALKGPIYEEGSEIETLDKGMVKCVSFEIFTVLRLKGR